MSLEIKFDGNQKFQLEAISAVVDLFEGGNRAVQESETYFDEKFGVLTQSLISNNFEISRSTLISNLEKIQSRVRVDKSGNFNPVIPENLRSEINSGDWPADFSIEMETGTGKTYVYLRTIMELFLKYGFTKFVVVVPSIAIKEGVVSTIRNTSNHFRDYYGGLSLKSIVYSSKDINSLWSFATSPNLQVLVINSAAFNREDNIINRETDKFNGISAINLIRAVNPVVIMDEPQLLGGTLTSKSIEELNPLFKLRYSATHKEVHNLVYRLTPLDAYQLNLVKQINVLSLTVTEVGNTAFIEVKKITSSSNVVSATLVVNKNGRHTEITVKRNSDLSELSNSMVYDSWIVEDIHARSEDSVAFIEFTNGVRLKEGSTSTLDLDFWHRAQIRAAIEEHFDTELRLKLAAQSVVILPMKPLTLFFVDRVANYAPVGSKFKSWFETEYEEVAAQRKFKNLEMPNPEIVHKGYFASSKSEFKDSKEGRNNKEDEEAFNLIMRNKEELLSFDSPVRFIFSHSALAEGWDNPNIFTICNLQETKSEIRKRQQVGRGLRLPVMSDGSRCKVNEINQLTIIATESFENFASGLQKQIGDETGIQFNDYVKNRRDRVALVLKEGFEFSSEFKELWAHISPKTRYSLKFDSEVFVSEAVHRLKNFEKITAPKLETSKQSIASMSTDGGLAAGNLVPRASKNLQVKASQLDLVNEILREIPVSRFTVCEVIRRSGRYGEVEKNPAQFVLQVRNAIFSALAETLKNHDGIEYQKITSGNDFVWKMDLFTKFHPVSYEDNLIEVSKSIYPRIPVDSKIEEAFARGLDARDDVELFIKLPSWFKIDTPVGGYNPDWAIVKRDAKNEKFVYLVRETKGSVNTDEFLRESEVWKVTFGRKHFSELGVDYKVVTKADQLDSDEN
jgi:type III restriction enzyme